MFLVGLTGGISMGKSTVCKIFQEKGVPIIDADQCARTVVEPGKIALKKIREEFGDEVINEDGTLNRAKLGQKTFGNKERLGALNRITHPEIFKEIRWLIIKYFFQGYPFVIIESPLLFESNTFIKFVSKVVVISCDENLQLKRLMERNNLSEEDAKARINSQMPIAEKIARADYVIENSGDLGETKSQVETIYKKLASCKAHWKIRGLAVFVLLVLGGVTAGIAYYFLH